MAVCPHCQIQLNPGTQFCPECGSQVPRDQQQNYQQSPGNQQSQGSQQYRQTQQPQQYQQQAPGPQEQYCSNCGAVVSQYDQVCQSCGMQLEDDFNDGLWIAGGVISFVIGIVVLAIVFGPLTIFIGYKVYSERDGVAGPLLMLGGALDIVLWLAFVSMVANSGYYYYGMALVPLV